MRYNTTCGKKQYNKGVTLFEVLLYIGLFSLVAISLIYLYISIVKTTDSIKLSMQRVEISLFIREIVRHKIDSQMNGAVNTNATSTGITVVSTPATSTAVVLFTELDRIMKFYPNFKLQEIEVENLFDVGTGYSDSASKYVKIEYTLVHKNVNSTAEKAFMQTMYIRRL